MSKSAQSLKTATKRCAGADASAQLTDDLQDGAPESAGACVSCAQLLRQHQLRWSCADNTLSMEMLPQPLGKLARLDLHPEAWLALSLAAQARRETINRPAALPAK